MKYTKLFVSAILFASVAVASANPVNTSHSTNVVFQATDAGLTGYFGAAYSGKKNDMFTDTFNFTVPASWGLDAGIQSVPTTVKGVQTLGVQFTSFDLYSGSTQLAQGDVATLGKQSFGVVSFGDLAAGSYSLKIAGKFTGTTGGSYSGNLNVSPVPEPETWSLMALGLAGVGVAARRRKSNKSA